MTPEIYEQMVQELRGRNAMSEKTLETFRKMRDMLIEKFAIGSFKRRLIAREKFNMNLLLGTTNSKTWAREFVKLNQGLTINAAFEETMANWFANAIETARDQGKRGVND